jgi:pimeloyl-ACP methyl ester carboxylesterase
MVRLHVETAGAGRSVVLSHGLGDTSATWNGVFAALRTTHRVTRWDLRGHGSSDRPDEAADYTRELAIADLIEMIGVTGAPAVLVGHSLGGYLSLALALRRPELVDGLVLVSSGPGFRDAAARDAWNRFIDESAPAMPISRPAAGLAYQHDSAVIDGLASLDCPLVQIVGERDVRFHAGVAHVERMIPASTTRRVAGAGHHVQRSHPDVVADAVRSITDRRRI